LEAFAFGTGMEPAGLGVDEAESREHSSYAAPRVLATEIRIGRDPPDWLRKFDRNRARGPPDGPRKASLITVVPQTGKICASASQYRGVGARPNETLLYGRWPG
jgi:hypothetical protein